MKRTLTLILILYLSFVAFIVSAQSNIRMNNYWIELNFINPASVYDKYEAVFNIAARDQWAGFNGAPQTFFASASTYLEKQHIQLGLSLIQDKAGYTSLTDVKLTYAYAIMLNNDWQLHLGLNGIYQSVNYDLAKIRVYDPDDPLILQLRSSNKINTDIGIEITNPFLKIGAASQNLVSLFSRDVNLHANTNIIYGRFYQSTTSTFDLSGGICGIQYADIYQAEFNLTGYFKHERDYGRIDGSNVFDVGIFYRTNSEVGLIFGVNISKSFHISYSYDYHFGAIRLGSYGTNELMLTYNLNKKPVCRNCWY